MSPVPSNVSENKERHKKASSKSPAEARRDEEMSEVEDSEPQSGVEQEGSGEEKEFVIESIIEAKVGLFPKNQIAYFVKWRGYSAEDNSWVVEEDAGNATELINAFWKEHDRKEVAGDSKRTVSASKSTAGADYGSDVVVGESASQKKRGRKAASEIADKGKATAKDNGGRPAKKARLSEKRAASKDEEALPSDEEFSSMAAHMQAPTWVHLVQQIDTVERSDDGTLYVYFTLHTGERVRERSTLCADKMQKMLISFYESHISWKGRDYRGP